MAVTIDYPAQLPPPQRRGYGINHVSPMMRTPMASGRARQRRLYTSVPSIVDVVWQFSEQQAQIFEGWFRWILSDGAEPFNARLRTPVGLRAYECRFAEMYDGPNLVGVDRWEFSAQLEILERQTIDAATAEHPELVLYQSLIDIAVNQEWPA